jgi:serine/threonine protein kinase
LEDLEEDVAEHLKIPLPEKLIFEKTYDFFDGVPKELHRFVRNSLHFPDFQDGAEIITLPGWLDRRGHVTEGQIGNTKVVLKRPRFSDDSNDRGTFYNFMDAVKEKLGELVAIINDDTLPEKVKKLRTKQIQNQLIGLGNIVPIVGITQIQRQNESFPEKIINEIIEISLKANSHTLHDCIKKKLPPYDTPQGVPRNQNIAIKLLLQLTHVTLVLHSCGYVNNDSNPKNIMITQNGPSFTLKLIDWGTLKQAKQPSNFTANVRNIIRRFYPILLGKQYILINRSRSYFYQEKNNTNSYFMEFSNLLQKSDIYSRETIDTIVKFSENILFENNEEKLEIETIISKLEELLNEDKKESENKVDKSIDRLIEKNSLSIILNQCKIKNHALQRK